MKNLSNKIIIEQDSESIISETVLNDLSQVTCISVNPAGDSVYMRFSSSQSMYDFALSLLHHAIYGDGLVQKEFFPLIVDGKPLVVEGVRLSENSARLFVDICKFPEER